MKKLIPLILLFILFYSCTGVEYKLPQPTNGTNLNEFPKKMRGEFEFKLIDGNQFSELDTIQIFSNYYKNKDNDKFYLSDSLIMRAYKDKYYVSFKGYNEEYWTVAQVVLSSDDKFIVNGVYDADDNKDLFIKKVNAITPLEIIKNNGTHYIINPTQKELGKLSRKNFFKPIHEATRIKK